MQGNVAAKGAQGYVFDTGNRLRQATGKETYAYDGQGRRVSSCAGASCARFVYSQSGQLLYTQDGRNDQRVEHLYLGGSLVALRARPLATETVTVRYQHTDALGSPVATTGADKAFLSQTEYEPYGQVVNGTLQDGPGYAGHVQDAATGLTYMQQRYYDPGIGRFLSVDPVTAYETPTGAFNRYWYANNNPYRFTDPDGRFGVVGGLIGGLIEIGVQMAVEGKSLGQVDKTDVAIAIAVGAVTGGVGGRLASSASKGLITSSQAVKETAKVGGAVSAAGSGAASIANGEAPSIDKMLIAGVAGAVGGAAGARIGNTPTAELEKLSKAGGVFEHISDATRSANIGRTAEASVSAGQEAAQVAIDAAMAALEKEFERGLKR